LARSKNLLDEQGITCEIWVCHGSAVFIGVGATSYSSNGDIYNFCFPTHRPLIVVYIVYFSDSWEDLKVDDVESR
jgi:hypothetical protein